MGSPPPFSNRPKPSTLRDCNEEQKPCRIGGRKDNHKALYREECDEKGTKSDNNSDQPIPQLVLDEPLVPQVFGLQP